MHDLVLDGEAFSVSLVGMITNCHLFQENKTLLAQPTYDVRSRNLRGLDGSILLLQTSAFVWFLPCNPSIGADTPEASGPSPRRSFANCGPRSSPLVQSSGFP
jgi:hypothetical protein